MLSCKMCGSPAELVNEKLVKSCACKCGVIMDMGHVKLKGIGSVKEKHKLQEVLDLLIEFIVNKYKELGGKV